MIFAQSERRAVVRYRRDRFGHGWAVTALRSFDLHCISSAAACGVEGYSAGTISSPAVALNPRGLNVYQSDAYQPDTCQPDTCQSNTGQPDTSQPDACPPNVGQPAGHTAAQT